MEVRNSLSPIGRKTAVAIGYFDGIHRGHRSVLDTALSEARKRGIPSVVFTFNMSRVRSAGKGSGNIFSQEIRKSMLSSLGFDYCVNIDFGDIRDCTDAEFVNNVIAQGCLDAEVICCGDDFRFGKGRTGDINTLRELCGRYGIEVIAASSVMDEGRPVSSTRIKEALGDGDMISVNRMLGYRYFIEGTVVKGNQVGRTLGFPTANIAFESGVIVPRKGVYVSSTVIDGTRYKCITNVGTRPTVTKDLMPISETNILDYSGDLYGRNLKIELIGFLRPEKKFSSVDELRKTVLGQIEYVRNLVID